MRPKLKANMLSALDAEGYQPNEQREIIRVLKPVVDKAIETTKNTSAAAHKRNDKKESRKCNPVICDLKVEGYKLHQRHSELLKAARALNDGDDKLWLDFIEKYGDK